jgi:hypothetical protein
MKLIQNFANHLKKKGSSYKIVYIYIVLFEIYQSYLKYSSIWQILFII